MRPGIFNGSDCDRPMTVQRHDDEICASEAVVLPEEPSLDRRLCLG